MKANYTKISKKIEKDVRNSLKRNKIIVDKIFVSLDENGNLSFSDKYSNIFNIFRLKTPNDIIKLLNQIPSKYKDYIMATVGDSEISLNHPKSVTNIHALVKVDDESIESYESRIKYEIKRKLDNIKYDFDVLRKKKRELIKYSEKIQDINEDIDKFIKKIS